jgi:pilus assembly protein Flp/PilA
MKSTVMKNLVDDTTGATSIEYGLILALIAIAISVSVQAFAGEAIEMWDGVSSDVVEATGG